MTNWFEVVGTWLASPAAPAWVQAIGSVLAIFASVGLVLWQHSLERARDEERAVGEREQRRLQMEAMLDAADMKMDFLLEAMATENPVNILLAHARREFRTLRLLGTRFDALALNDKFASAAWMSFLNALEQADDVIQFEEASVGFEPDECRAILRTHVQLLKQGVAHVKNMVRGRAGQNA